MVSILKKVSDAYRKKLLKDPDIIPPKGKTKEEVVDELINAKLRQRKNNKRANNLLNAEIADPGGGSKAGGDSAMYRLTQFVQKPIENAEDNDMPPVYYKEPKPRHIKKANRLIEFLELNVDDVKIGPFPKHMGKAHKKEIEFVKQFKNLRNNEDFLNNINNQDEDLLDTFYRYLRDKNINLTESQRGDLDAINRDTNTLLFKFKLFYNRPRPHQVSDDITEIENVGGKTPSYPAGHSASGYVIGEWLASQFPEHATELRNIGLEVGLNRILVGLHFPSDHIAGRELGEQIVDAIPSMDSDVKKSDGFMDELFKYMEHRAELFKDMTQIGTQDILDEVRIDKEKNPRIPRKKGQPAKSKKHSDLYTDEDPKGTITGLGFKDDATAKASVKKIRNSGRSHAHKIQAAVAMEQRAKVAGKSSEAGIYRKFIDSMKEKTKQMEKHTDEEHAQEHEASDNYYPKVSVDKSKKSLLDQLDQIQSKITTGDYDIKKSEDIFLEKAPKYDINKVLTEEQFKEVYKKDKKFSNSGYIEDLQSHLQGKYNDLKEEAKKDSDLVGKLNKLAKTYNNFSTQIQDIPEGLTAKQAYTIYKQEADKLNEFYELPPPKNKPTGSGGGGGQGGQGGNQKKKKEKKTSGSSGGGTSEPKEPPKAPKNHQNKIDDIKKAHAKLVKHATAFANEKNIHLKGGHAGFKGHFEKYNTAKTVYDNAVRAEKKFKNRSFVKGQDFMKEPKAPKLLNSEKKYMEKRKEIMDNAEKDGLNAYYHKKNHSSKYSENFGKPSKSKAELHKLPNKELAKKYKELEAAKQKEEPKEEPKPEGPSRTEKLKRGNEVKEEALKISSEVFRQEGRDKKGRPIFMIKPDKDKHDVLMGMYKIKRLMEVDWHEDGKFGKPGSVNDRKEILDKEAFATITAIGSSFGAAGGKEMIDAVNKDYEEKGDDFFVGDHKDGIEKREKFEESQESEKEHQKSVEEMRENLFDSEVFDNVDAKDMQRLRSAADEEEAKQGFEGLSDEEEEQKRIEAGLPPKGSQPPMFSYKDEEGNQQMIQAEWHPESHRWINPKTYDGSTGHFAGLQSGDKMHMTDEEFNEAMGGNTMIDSTASGGVIVSRGKDGNLNVFSTQQASKDMYGNKTSAANNPNIKDANHAKRSDVMHGFARDIQNDENRKAGETNKYKKGKGGLLARAGSIEVKNRSKLVAAGEKIKQATPQQVRDLAAKVKTLDERLGKIPSKLGTRAGRGALNYVDKVTRSVTDRDARRFEARAKKFRKEKGRKPNINLNNPQYKHQFAAMSKKQRRDLSRHVNFFMGET